MSSLLLTAPRCLLKTPSSPAEARRKCAGPASPEEQGTNATLISRSFGCIAISVQTLIAQLSSDNKTWSIYTNLFDVNWGAGTLPQIGDTLLLRSSSTGHYLAHIDLIWTSGVPALSLV